MLQAIAIIDGGGEMWGTKQNPKLMFHSMQVEPVLEEAGEVVARGKLNVVKAIQSRNQTARGGNETREKVNSV